MKPRKHRVSIAENQVHKENNFDFQYVNVWPQQGNLEPGESCVCKVTFTAIGVPSFYDVDLVCEVRNASSAKTWFACI